MFMFIVSINILIRVYPSVADYVHWSAKKLFWTLILQQISPSLPYFSLYFLSCALWVLCRGRTFRYIAPVRAKMPLNPLIFSVSVKHLAAFWRVREHTGAIYRNVWPRHKEMMVATENLWEGKPQKRDSSWISQNTYWYAGVPPAIQGLKSTY